MAAKRVPTVDNNGISKDGLIYTFELRQNLKWSDGQDLFASDFEFAIKRMLDPRTRSPIATKLFFIKGAEALNRCVACTSDDLERLKSQVGVRAPDNHRL